MLGVLIQQGLVEGSEIGILNKFLGSAETADLRTTFGVAVLFPKQERLCRAGRASLAC